MFKPGQEVVVAGGIRATVICLERGWVWVRLTKTTLKLRQQDVQTEAEYAEWVDETREKT